MPGHAVPRHAEPARATPSLAALAFLRCLPRRMHPQRSPCRYKLVHEQREVLRLGYHLGLEEPKELSHVVARLHAAPAAVQLFLGPGELVTDQFPAETTLDNLHLAARHHRRDVLDLIDPREWHLRDFRDLVRCKTELRQAQDRAPSVEIVECPTVARVATDCFGEQFSLSGVVIEEHFDLLNA